jgi:hypothetical protein
VAAIKKVEAVNSEEVAAEDEVHHMAAEVDVAEEDRHHNNNHLETELVDIDIEEEAVAVVVAALEASTLAFCLPHPPIFVLFVATKQMEKITVNK